VRVTAQFAEVHRLAISGLRRRELFAAAALEMLLLLCDAENALSQPTTLDPRVQATVETICARQGGCASPIVARQGGCASPIVARQGGCASPIVARQGGCASPIDARRSRPPLGPSGDRLTLENLAAAVHLSPSRLSHLFRVQVGMPPLQFLDRQRADRARLLLMHSSEPIGAIAAEFGFDPLYFSRWFKRHTGVSPRAYREKEGRHE